MVIKFREISKPLINKMFLELIFEGGDGDTKHPMQIELKGITLDNYINKLSEIEEIVNTYKTLKNILNINSVDFLEDYNEVLIKYGDKVAHAYDITPGDPQNDYQNRTYLGKMTLVAYDEKGTRWESYL